MRRDVSGGERIRRQFGLVCGSQCQDRNNAAAKQLLGASSNLITTDHVLIESWLVMRRHIHRRAAEEYWEGIRNGLAVVEKVELADLEAAWAIGQAFPDQDFSIVDRTKLCGHGAIGPHPCCKLRQRLRDLPLWPQSEPGVRDPAVTLHRADLPAPL